MAACLSDALRRPRLRYSFFVFTLDSRPQRTGAFGRPAWTSLNRAGHHSHHVSACGVVGSASVGLPLKEAFGTGCDDLGLVIGSDFSRVTDSAPPLGDVYRHSRNHTHHADSGWTLWFTRRGIRTSGPQLQRVSNLGFHELPGSDRIFLYGFRDRWGPLADLTRT